MNHETDESRQIYNAILTDPHDDTRRLAYADYLTELGSEPALTLAECIRRSYRLDEIGQPPFGLYGLMVPRGKNYWEMIESKSPQLYVGARVNVRGIPASRNVRMARRAVGKLIPNYHRLLVARIEPDDPDLDTIRIGLKRDADSTPFPTDEYNEHRKWLTEHTTGIFNNPATMVPVVLHPYPGELDRTSYIDFTTPAVAVSRGFPGVVAATWNRWMFVGDHLIGRWPITRVRFPVNVSGFHVRFLGDYINQDNVTMAIPRRGHVGHYIYLPPIRYDSARQLCSIVLSGKTVNLQLTVPDTIRTNPAAVVRHILTARWPMIKPYGWVFGSSGDHTV